MLAQIVFGTCMAMHTIGPAVAQDATVPARLDLAEIFRIGDDENDPLLFGFVTALDINAAGQVYAVDGSNNSIYVLSDSGELVDEIGREGAGPGEFEDISGLYVGPGDSVYVLDSDLYRLSVFEPDMHRFMYSVRIEADGMRDPVQLLGVVDNEFLIVYSSPMYPGLEATHDRRAVVNLVSRDGIVIGESVVSLPDREYVASQRYILLVPFGRRFEYRLGADGLVYSGLSDRIDIGMTTVGGGTQGSVQYDHPAVPVTREDIDNYVSDMSSDARRLILASDIPAKMPAYQSFSVDDRGRIWIQLIGEGGTSSGKWLLLSKEGEAVARAVLPASVSLHVVREGIAYGNGKSESGAPYVVAYRIDE